MKTIDSPELYNFFRDFRFALNGDTGAENFMMRQGAAYQVYKAAVTHIDGVKFVMGADHEDPAHFDDVACIIGGTEMSHKMAIQRQKGYGGWSNPALCSTELLQRMLVEHVAKGDPVDVMVIANMLRHRGEPTSKKVLFEDRPVGRDAALAVFKERLNKSEFVGRCDIDALFAIYQMGRDSAHSFQPSEAVEKNFVPAVLKPGDRLEWPSETEW